MNKEHMQQLRNDYGDDELKAMMNQGKLAEEMVKTQYWKILEKSLINHINAFIEKRRESTVRQYLIAKNKEDILLNDTLEEVGVESKIEILKQVELTIVDGKYAEIILSNPKIKKSTDKQVK